MLAAEVDRAENHLRAGAPLVKLVSPELRPSVELFAAGGLAILAAIRRADYDVLTARPTLSRWQKGRLVLRAAARRYLPGGGRA